MNQPVDEHDDFWVEAQAQGTAQAIALREQAGRGGLRFEAYLPPDLALWVLALIERGTFIDPSEAAFVILGEHRDLEPHADLRRELLSRTLQASIDDPGPTYSAEDVTAMFDKIRSEPRPDPAVWHRPRHVEETES